jgi:trimeric autotransporter adhesin
VRQLLLLLFSCSLSVYAAQQSGSVRAADQFIPGAKITAHLVDAKADAKGDTKVVAYTDENGRYSLNLAPGDWELDVEMLGFTTAHGKITVPSSPAREGGDIAASSSTTREGGGSAPPKDWTLEMPRYGQSARSITTDAPKPAAAGVRTRQPGQGRGQGQGQGRDQGGRGFANRPAAPGAPATPSTTAANRSNPGGPPSPNAPPNTTPGNAPGRGRGGFQSASVTATSEGQDALAQAASQASSLPTFADQPDDSFMVIGSSSGGLAQSSDDEARRQRAMAGGRGGPGGPGGPGGLGAIGGFGDSASAALGLPPGMSVTSDSLGLGGLGASAINGGFGGDNGGAGFGGLPGGAGPGGGPGFGGAGGRGGGGGAGGGGGGRGGGGAGGGGRGGRGAQNANRRGPYNGQFASFGNRRRTRPQYTGSIFANLNNSALNAAPFSLNGQPVPKPSYSQTNFGANFGGPLIVPKLVNWQAASFYLTYQGRLSRNPYNQVSSVPTLLERGGDFSQLLTAATPIVLYDPTTHQPFQSNVIPTRFLNQAALGLLSYFPLPTYSGLVQNYRNTTSVPNNSGNIGVRLNAPLSRKDRLNFNVQLQNRNSETEQLFGFRDSTTGSGLSATTGWNHSFKPRLNNSATLTFSRNNNKAAPFFAYSTNVAAELGIMGTSQDPINYGPPNLSFTNFGGLTDGSASVTRNQTTNFNDGINFVYKRKHNLQFGFLFRRIQQNSLTYQNARGSFSFSGLVTSEINAQGQPVSGTGYDFADFLLGLPQSSSLRFGSDNNYFRGWSMGAYAQDDFRVSRSLSINFGLRYEYFTPFTELQGHLSNLDLNPGFTAAAVVTPGMAGPYSGDLPSSLVRPEKKDFSPRFGFAWRPSQKRNMVIRGGYSLFYTASPYQQIATQLASQPPFATSASISTSPTNLLTIENGFATAPSQTITNTYAIDPNFHLPYAQTWSFAIQNTFKHGMLVEIEEIGTKGTHLGVVEQPNRSVSTSIVNAQQTLQIANASGFNYQTSGATSIFNAGQVRVTRRFATGMSGNLLYTFSKSIDNASSFNGVGGTTVQFIDNLALERGLSTFDQRHKLAGTYLLSSPVGLHGFLRNGGWKTHALTGWTLQNTVAASSGTPLTAKVGGNLSNTGGIGALGGSRAQATGQPIEGTNGAFFNTAAFTIPVAGQFGNAGRDTIPGPFQLTVNAALNRAFKFGESRRTLQLRLSANNVLNHVVVTGYGTTVNSSTYGLATAASPTRTITLMLRFNF